MSSVKELVDKNEVQYILFCDKICFAESIREILVSAANDRAETTSTGGLAGQTVILTSEHRDH